MPKLIWSEEYWSLRAEHARASVALQEHAECGRIMRDIAASYAHLAELSLDYEEAAKAGGNPIGTVKRRTNGGDVRAAPVWPEGD
jgi:hypothetical protein